LSAGKQPRTAGNQPRVAGKQPRGKGDVDDEDSEDDKESDTEDRKRNVKSGQGRGKDMGNIEEANEEEEKEKKEKEGKEEKEEKEKKVDLAYNRAMKFSEEVLQNLENNYQEDVNNNNVIVFDSIEKVSSLLNEHPTDHTYIFYFIRHGEGEHNVASRFKKMNLVDPELTKGGVESTISINKALLDDIYVECAKIDDKNVYVFSSDLYRTRETLQYSIYGLDKIFKNMDNSIHVLPCSHELNYFNSGECDKKNTISGNENKSNCKTLKYDENQIQQDTYGCDQVLLVRNPKEQVLLVRNPKEHGKYKRYEKGISYPIKDSRIWNIHWKHYNDFYKGTRRKPSRKRKYCKNTNMVEQALEIMERRPIMEGARKKKRKTRKRKKMKKRKQ
jgi:hypothetical protein